MIEIHEYSHPNNWLGEEELITWLTELIESFDSVVGELNIVLHNDSTLHEMNVERLNHDTLTDIITDDFVVDTLISGDLHISLDRVVENAKLFSVSNQKENLRVVAHGVLHLLGYKDKTQEEKDLMREEENKALSLYENMFHVEL